MKLFRLSTYRLYRPDFFEKHKQVKVPFRVMVMADLHFNYHLSNDKLQIILSQVKSQAPDYLLFPGDLINSADVVDKQSERERLLEFLECLGRLTTVILSLGNHDNYRKSKKSQHGWQYDQNTVFFNQIRSMKNIHLLDNQVYEDENIYCLGYTQSPSYYHPKDQYTENFPLMLEELASLPENYLINLPKHKLKFALVHSPVYLNTPEAKYYLREFDYFISGHMHNGLVPPILDEFWSTSYGIISPTKKLVPDNVRNTLRTYADKLLTVGALTTFCSSTHPSVLNFLNAFFPSYLAVLEFTKNKTHSRKPYIKHTYKNW